jgi:hypothetical protein
MVLTYASPLFSSVELIRDRLYECFDPEYPRIMYLCKN